MFMNMKCTVYYHWLPLTCEYIRKGSFKTLYTHMYGYVYMIHIIQKHADWQYI